MRLAVSARPSFLPQKLECVRPLVAKEARDAPKHAQRLDGPRRLGLAHVGGFPAELVEDVAHDLLRDLVIAAYEHRRLASLELRVHHERIADRVEGLDEARLRELALQT